MHLKAKGEVLNYLLFDYSYINEITKSKIGNMYSVIQQNKNPLAYPNLQLPVAKCSTYNTFRVIKMQFQIVNNQMK